MDLLSESQSIPAGCLAVRQNEGVVKRKRIAIVVLNWNGWRDTVDCIASLCALENDDIGMFVCDNASTDGSLDHVRAWLNTSLDQANDRRVAAAHLPFQWRALSDVTTDGTDAKPLPEGSRNTITLIQTGRNGGYSAGNNVGLRFGLADDFDYFWVINNDVEVEPDALKWLLARMEERPDVGICGSTLIYASQRDTVQALGGATFSTFRGWGRAIGAHTKVSDPIDRDAVEAQLRFVSGAAMFISRSFLEKIGLMQEDYFLYWEELDWAYRAKRLFKLGYAPKSIVYHKVGASIGTNDFGEASPLSDYYMTRSHVKFCLRFSMASLPMVFADIGLNIFRYLRSGNWSRAKLLLRAAMGFSYNANA